MEQNESTENEERKEVNGSKLGRIDRGKREREEEKEEEEKKKKESSGGRRGCPI